MGMNGEASGHALYSSRLESIPVHLQKMLDDGVTVPNFEKSNYFYVTGIGSSEAHARFLVELINEYTHSHATFVNTSHFLKRRQAYQDATLIVFSQGISANSRIALEQHKLFRHTIVFTAADESKTTHYDCFRIPFPVAEEYDILIRVVGPMTGYLVSLQFVAAYWKNNTLPALSEKFIDFIHRPTCIISDNLNISDGAVILASDPLINYAQNLSYKLTEGVFAKCVSICDYLSFVHGPFQELLRNPRPIIMLKNNSEVDNQLTLKAMSLVHQIKAASVLLESRWESPYSILEFESMFNCYLEKRMILNNVDQINWPGKGKDGAIYHIEKPF